MPFALGIEARGRFVEDQNARIGQHRARNRDALALSARQLHTALAYHGIVCFSKPSMNSPQCAILLAATISSRDAPGREKLMLSRNRAVEQEIILHHYAQMMAVVAQRDHSPDRGHRWSAAREGRLKANQADQRALAGTAEPY